LFKELYIDFKADEVKKLFYAIDVNKSGFISYPEFLSYIHKAVAASKKIQRERDIKARTRALAPEDYPQETVEISGDRDVMSRLELRNSLLENKDKNSIRHIQNLEKKMSNLDGELGQVESQNKNLENHNTRLQQTYLDIKKELASLETHYRGCLNKQDGETLQRQNYSLRLDLSQTLAGVEMYKNMYEACLREVKSLRTALGRRDDEVDQLRKAMKEMQSVSDEKALAGKLFQEVLTAKWNEGAANQKYDIYHDELRK
jgi:chromosome segregation ATPase